MPLSFHILKFPHETSGPSVPYAMAVQIRVAIVGGSIAGCTLANGLLQYPNVLFDVFESKPIFTERGASVGLAANATNALRAMGMDVDRALRDAGAMRMTSTTYLAVCCVAPFCCSSKKLVRLITDLVCRVLASIKENNFSSSRVVSFLL